MASNSSILDGFKWTETRATLQQFKSLLSCSLCGDVAASPHNLGRCQHIFCHSCLDEHKGGACPAPQCGVHAPAGEARPNKVQQQITLSVMAIGELLLGEPKTERLKENQVLKEVTIQDRNETKTASSKEKNLIPSKNTKQVGSNLKRNSLPLPGRKLDKPLKQKRLKTTSSGAVKFSKQKEDIDMISSGKINSLATKKSGTKNKNCSIPTANISFGSDSDFEPTSLDNVSIPSTCGKDKTGPSKLANIASSNVLKPTTVAKQKISPKVKQKPVDKLNKKNKKGETPLHTAAGKGDLETVRRLLGEGASPNTWDNAGWTPLHEASGYGNLPLVTMLLDAGASPSVPATNENMTPLHDAATRGFVDVVAILVARGADTAAKDSRGRTPKDVAHNEKIVEALETEVEVSCSQLDRSQVMEERKEVVVAAPGVGEAMWKQFGVAAGKAGVVRISKTVIEEATHCLVEPKESLDYYMALLCGAELVTSEWLMQCGASGNLVDEEPFRVCVPGGNREGLSKAREGRSKRLPGLMAGGHVCLVGSFDNVFPTRQNILKLVKIAGGKIVTREPDPELIPPDEQTVFYHAAANSSLVNTSHIIIYQAGSRKEPMIKYKMPHLKTLPVSWLFECFNTYSLVEPNLFE